MGMLMNQAHPEWLPTLGSGEQLLWRGQASRQLLALRMSDLVHVPTGLLLLVVGMNLDAIFDGFGGFGNLGDDPSPRPPVFTFIGVAFVVSGLFELIGRHIINFVRRYRTSYALTTHRVFIRTGLFQPVTRERSLTPSDPPEFKIGGNGTGTIVFAPPERRRWSGRGNRGRDLVDAVSAGLDGFQFFGVPDADRVRALLAND